MTILIVMFLFVDGRVSVQADRNPASLNETVTLTCYTDISNPTFRWQLNGTDLQTIGSTLSVPLVSATDGGTYTCRITSVFFASRTVYVNPYFTTTPMSMSIIIREDFSSPVRQKVSPLLRLLGR